MLLSLAIIIVVGWLLGQLLRKIGLPALIGYLLMGMLFGPHLLNILAPSLVNIAGDIRSMALVIILTRAGLSMNLDDLKKVGRPALMLTMLPGLFEIFAYGFLAPAYLGIQVQEGLLMGTVMAAVSPAVLVPRMSNLIDRQLGTDQGIPQMILAGAAADDVVIFTLFASFMSINQGGSFNAVSLINIPLTIIVGLALGWLFGKGLMSALRRWPMTKLQSFVLVLIVGFFLMGLEGILPAEIPYSAVLSILVMNMMVCQQLPEKSKEVSRSFNQVWAFAEIFLFSMLGVAVNPTFIQNVGWIGVALIFSALLFRSIGVGLSLIGTSFSWKEKFFVFIAYLPKATEQAAIGGIPLAAGLAVGPDILAVATLSILITAPLGAVLVDFFAPRCLRYSEKISKEKVAYKSRQA